MPTPRRAARLRDSLATAPERDGGDLRCRLRLQRPVLRQLHQSARHDADPIGARAAPGGAAFRRRRLLARRHPVASSAQGVAAIMLGDEPEALLRQLQDAFPKATLIGGDAEYEKLVARVVGLVEAPRLGLGLPLDIRGNRLPAARLAGAAADPGRHHRKLRRRSPPGSACRRQFAAVAGACAANTLADGDSLSPRGAQRRRAVRLSLGGGAQAAPAGAGGSGMIGDATQVAALDWGRHRPGELDRQGWAVLPGLDRSRTGCADISAAVCSPAETGFRSRVVMGQHGYGQGEYRYFAYPLPALVHGVARRAVSAFGPDRQCLARANGAAGPLSGRRMRRFPRALPSGRPAPPDAAAAAIRAGRL